MSPPPSPAVRENIERQLPPLLRRGEHLLLSFEEFPEQPALLIELHQALDELQLLLAPLGNTYLDAISMQLSELLSALQQERIRYDQMQIDIVQGIVDQSLGHAQHRDLNENRLQQIASSLAAVSRAEPDQLRNSMYAALLVLDPHTRIDEIELARPPADPHATNRALHRHSVDDTLQHFAVENSADLQFLRGLIEPMEQRSRYWYGRSSRLLRLCLAMNRQGGSPVDPTQLTAAVLVHDISMAFLPVDVLHKKERLNLDEKKMMQGHARSAYELLHRMRDWEPAAKMVLQHHERADGSGYPLGLREPEICDGAKIIAIADTFDARTHERAYRDLQRRPLVRAILEINRESGIQFSPTWVRCFNQIAPK